MIVIALTCPEEEAKATGRFLRHLLSQDADDLLKQSNKVSINNARARRLHASHADRGDHRCAWC